MKPKAPTLGALEPELAEVLEKLGLPDPIYELKMHRKQREVTRGFECYLLFLNPFGIMMRASLKQDYKPVDRHPVIQPIGTITTEHFVVELLPGVNTAKLGALMESPDFDIYKELSYATQVNDKLKEDAKGSGVLYADDKPDNMGFLPLVDEKNPIGEPVILDRGGAYASSWLWPHKRAMGWLNQDDAKLERVDAIYAPLREAFDAAWPGDRKQPGGSVDPEKMQAFWATCRDWCKDMERTPDPRKWRLSCAWLNGPEYKVGSALRYEGRLRDAPPDQSKER